ncbi:hypothetical protein [Mesorhizobium sp. M1273]|uniref:hypothetical protein n=1 Tax=Mesorhizobium sp. M1273 TaxID=2957075 RepID=UPI00333B21E2
MLSGFGLANPYLRVLASMAVDGQDHVARIVIDIRHDVLDERAQQLLTTAHVDTRRIPGGLEILGEAREVRNRVDRLRTLDFAQPGLAGLHAPERGFQLLSSWPAISRFSGSQAASPAESILRMVDLATMPLIEGRGCGVLCHCL